MALTQVRDFLQGGLATATAVLFTNPIDVMKTRMQLQGELTRDNVRVYKNPIQTFHVIFKNEGIRGLQSGLTSACIHQFVMNGTRLYTYDIFKPIVNNYISLYPATLISGAASGVLGAVLASPFALAKTRLQSQNTKFKNTRHAIDSVIKQDGIKGLWRGAQAAALRVGIGSAVQLSTYERVKMILIKFPLFPSDAVRTHFVGSFITSFVLVLAIQPFDTVSTRMYNQKPVPGQPPMYQNLLDCLNKTFRIEGVRGLYKGSLENYLRLGPHVILTFVFWEQFKKLNRRVSEWELSRAARKYEAA
jgi:solute carrier family 25 protein 34/35